MNRVALITGGAQGLGKSFAEALLKKGSRVCVADVNTSHGKETVRTLGETYGADRVLFVKCDVTNSSDIENALKVTKDAFHKLDLVCNSAGIINEIDWNLTVAVNLSAVIAMSRLAIQYMKNNGSSGGHIINVASLAGLVPAPELCVYSATKFGVVGYSRSIAMHPTCLDSGIRVNCLCPAYTDTNILKITPAQVSKQELKMSKANLELMGLMSVDKVTEAFMQLVEDESQNGSVLTVTTAKGIAYKQYRYPPTKL